MPRLSERGVQASADPIGRERKMRDYEKATTVVTRILHEFLLREPLVICREFVELKCVALLVSYCCDTIKVKGMSANFHRVMAKKPYN